MHVFGTGIQSVSCLKAPNHTVYHLHYGDTPGRPEHGVVINCAVAVSDAIRKAEETGKRVEVERSLP